jgi:hypothetical protein
LEFISESHLELHLHKVHLKMLIPQQEMSELKSLSKALLMYVHGWRYMDVGI